MTEIDLPQDIRVGLNLILYELFYLDSESLKNTPPFGEKQLRYYSGLGEKKPNEIGLALEWAVENKSYPFNTVYPRHGHIDNDQISAFLSNTLTGLVDSNLYKRRNVTSRSYVYSDQLGHQLEGTSVIPHGKEGETEQQCLKPLGDRFSKLYVS
jgi:hypothetical protein